MTSGIREVELSEVFISYIDDSGSLDKRQKFQLMTAVLVADEHFKDAESLTAGPLVAFIPEEKQDEFHEKFQEFKGWELFRGKGPFEGIDENIRLKIMQFLLIFVRSFCLPVIFGAINKAEWDKEKSASGSLFVYGGSSEDDICFRACMKGVATYIEHNHPSTFALLISDDCTDRARKDRIRKAFYGYRKRFKPKLRDLELAHERANPNGVVPSVVDSISNEMPYLHDDMYFGDSRYSIGIQLADLCGYVIAKHLVGDPDQHLSNFYKLIKPQVMYSRVEPGGHLIHPDPVAERKSNLGR